MTDADLVHAPFTDEQVEALNAFQKLGYFHPFTCGHDHDGDRILVAANDGWHCVYPGCEYTQNWAHVFMADKAKHPPRPTFGKQKS